MIIAAWMLQQTGLDQRAEHAHPVQRDQPERDVHGIVLAITLRETGRAVGDAHQYAQQRELVGRCLLIAQHDVAQQRQCAGAIVGQREPQGLPRHLRPPAGVGAGSVTTRLQSVAPRDRLHLAGSDRIHRAIGGRRPAAQRDHDAAAGAQHRDQLAHRTLAHAGRYVHPHRAHPHQIEGRAGTQHRIERRQPIGEPADRRVRMASLRRTAHRRRGLHRHYLVTARGEPGRIAARTGTNVEHAGGLLRNQVEHRGVHLLEGQRLVAARQCTRLHVVRADRVLDPACVGPLPGAISLEAFAHDPILPQPDCIWLNRPARRNA